MAGQKAKGIGGAGCCCGGCRVVPHDGSASTAEIIPIQQFCCRCIPKLICIAVTSGYGVSRVLVPRNCGGVPDGGAPIQYTAIVSINGEGYTINVRLEVRDEQCYITWDIPDLDLEGERLIDPEDQVDTYACNHGMKARACAEFGGEWDLEEEEISITISEPATLDLKDLIECGGCSCMCKCLCFSIYSRSSDGIFTLIGTNEIVCAELSRETTEDCGDPEFFTYPWFANWESHGWNLSIGDIHEHAIMEAVDITGTEEIDEACSVRAATWKGDEFEHSIIGSDAQVTYKWGMEDRVAKRVKWVGRSHDEESVVLFEAYNWDTMAWDTLAIVDGRPDSTDVNRALVEELDPDYTGTGLDLGKVSIRLTLMYGTSLHTGMIRLVTDQCCRLRLTPPAEVTLVDPPADIELTGANACPDPSGFWELEAEDGTDWFVSVGCSWCGSTCGTVATSCCPRPLGNTLFAEVAITCPACVPGIVVVPLTSDGTGAIWTGDVTLCDFTLFVTVSCGGGGWTCTVIAGGGCNFGPAVATDVTCDPLLLQFAGELQGGIGCCGPASGGIVTAPISIEVFE